jgi:hypothetical protein
MAYAGEAIRDTWSDSSGAVEPNLDNGRVLILARYPFLRFKRRKWLQKGP